MIKRVNFKIYHLFTFKIWAIFCYGIHIFDYLTKCKVSLNTFLS